jgi:hypothetical protein
LVPIDEDVQLLFTSQPDRGKLNIKARPSDQLYWDLPPGQEKKGPGGGTYGCYGLDSFFYDRPIETLADLGAAIAKVRGARKQWRKKHQLETGR